MSGDVFAMTEMVAVRKQVTSLLSDLVAIPSYGANEGPILQYLVQRFQRQGIPCRTTEVDGKPLNVVAEIGQGTRAIILNSHVDTVPPGDPALWQTDPLTPVEKDGRIYGRGAEDAKGCLAAMIVAFETLAARRTQLPVRVILMAVGARGAGRTGDESGSGERPPRRCRDRRGVYAARTEAGPQGRPAPGGGGEGQGGPRQRPRGRGERRGGHGARGRAHWTAWPPRCANGRSDIRGGRAW